jgi:tRNA-dihydrouridine synthase
MITVDEILKRLLKSGAVTFTIEASPEEDDPEGHFASDDPEADREMIEDIKRNVRNGNVWAWCSVKVTAEWNGAIGVDTLGGCSYASEEEFCHIDCYYADMRDAAIRDLAATLHYVLSHAEELRAALNARR